MPKSPRQLIREYFEFSRKDRHGIIILAICILLILGGHMIVARIHFDANEDFGEFDAAVNNHLSEPLRNTGPKKFMSAQDDLYNDGRDTLNNEGEENIPAAFDPNTAEKEVLEKFGFNDYQASNLLKYRDKGGYFLRPEDLLRIYGIDSVFFNKILEYIRIDSMRLANIINKTKNSGPAVQLNTADSLELAGLRGIGPVFASRILKYRDLLGGYYSKKQLLEVYNFPEETFLEIKDRFRIDRSYIKKIRINFAGYADFIRHPYLNKEEVRKILAFRSKKGPFISTDQLLKEGLLDSLHFVRIGPYLSSR